MTREAREICQVLGKDLEGSLAKEVASAGDKSSDGSTQRLVVEQKESLRHQLLARALAEHTDRQARPVTVFQNISDDKVAGRHTYGKQPAASQSLLSGQNGLRHA